MTRTAKLPITKEELFRLPAEQAQAIIGSLSREGAEALRRDWEFNARADQRLPGGPWDTALALAGRGWGKNRVGAEFVRARVRSGSGYLGFIGATSGDIRDTMVEGESGVLSVCYDEDRDHRGQITGRPLYEPSKRRLTWQNGARASLFSAEEPDRLRGPQHDTLFCDELCSWKNMRETWDMAMFGLRLGDDPRAIVTTTPKPTSLLKEIMADPGTVLLRGSTYANRANLAKKFLDRVLSKYEGTRLGRQELYAELMDEAEGALWTRQLIEDTRRPKPEHLTRIVVAVDPAVTDKEGSDETGIVVCGRDAAGHGYVLADVSKRCAPVEWARRVVDAYHLWGADRVIAEGNQGGDLVKLNIATVDAAVASATKIVHASRGKQARAEPISSLFEQGRCHLAEPFPALEDQMVEWEPQTGAASPDRIDAMVWGMTELLCGPQVSYTAGRVRMR